MFALLNVDKPAGITSRDVVDRVAALLPRMKIGHAGTLDPMATGVLVLCLGRATRLVPYVQQYPKSYEATFQLGLRSNTDDIEGQLSPLEAPVVPDRASIEQLLPSFRGEILQRPPPVSAVKVQGQRAYKLARQGKTPRLDPRPVTVHELEVTRYDYPELELTIRCGSGTYVRALGRDLAEQAGTAAVMTRLRRTAIGPFNADQAVSLAALTAENLLEFLQPARLAVAMLPHVRLSDQEVAALRNGRFLDRPDHNLAGEAAAFNARGELLAILAPRSPHQLGPVRNFG